MLASLGRPDLKGAIDIPEPDGRVWPNKVTSIAKSVSSQIRQGG